MTEERLLTPEDLAERFSVTRRRIMEWQHIHNWPCVRVGRTFRWTPHQVEQIAAMHTVKGAKVISDGRTKLSARRSA